jgi:excisionase family DNA binding protein
MNNGVNFCQFAGICYNIRMDELMTYEDAAERIGCGVRNVRMLVKRGDLVSVRISYKIRRVTTASVELYLRGDLGHSAPSS